MVTVLAQIAINEDAPRQLAKYFEITKPLLAKAGAKIVRRYNMINPIIGAKSDTMIVIVEYPSRAAVDTVFGSVAYQEALPYRDAAFNEYKISICETEEMAVRETEPVVAAD